MGCIICGMDLDGEEKVSCSRRGMIITVCPEHAEICRGCGHIETGHTNKNNPAATGMQKGSCPAEYFKKLENKKRR